MEQKDMDDTMTEPALDAEEAASAEKDRAESPEMEPGQEETFQQLIRGKWHDAYEQAVGQRIQSAIQQRFRNQKDWQKQIKEWTPIAQALSEKYGLAPDDYQGILERMTAESGQGQARPAPGNVPAPAGEDAFLRRHFDRMALEAEEMKRRFPGFDLQKEMRDPAFVRLTAPGSGMSVKDAFFALHGEEIQRDTIRYAASQARDRIAASVRAGASRPMENGMEKPGSAQLAVDIEGMDRQAREEYRRRIRSGETIDFVKNV